LAKHKSGEAENPPMVQQELNTNKMQ